MPTAGGLYYEEHGSGPPLILSAGLGGAGGYWASNLPALAEHFRVIAYDHRGTGKSDPAIPSPTSIDDMARDIIALMDDIGLGQVDFMGHALGAIIGLALARIDPSRIGKLISVNGWSKTDPFTLRCFAARLHILNSGGPAAYLDAQPIFLFPAPWIETNQERLAEETASQLSHFQGEQTLRIRIAAASAFDATSWIGSITADVLALSAEDDLLVPSIASGRLYHGLRCRKTRNSMQRGGHACNVTDPDTFNRIVLDFLRS